MTWTEDRVMEKTVTLEEALKGEVGKENAELQGIGVLQKSSLSGVRATPVDGNL